MYTIFCYGDSNTWGYDPEHGKRYPVEKTWPNVMQKKLGDGFLVHSEGLNGRTTGFEDPTWPNRNGKTNFPAMLEAQAPCDLIVIMLGTNDLKHRFELNVEKVADNISDLIDIISETYSSLDYLKMEKPRILIISPPAIKKEDAYENEFEGAIVKSKLLAKLYECVAEKKGCCFLKGEELVKLSDIDGVHFTQDDHFHFGEAVADYILTSVLQQQKEKDGRQTFSAFK